MQNPLPESEGGYGNGAGLRIVYQLIRCSDHMLVAVIGVRADGGNEFSDTLQGKSLQFPYMH